MHTLNSPFNFPMLSDFGRDLSSFYFYDTNVDFLRCKVRSLCHVIYNLYKEG